jgi:protein-histidine pros-kinase
VRWRRGFGGLAGAARVESSDVGLRTKFNLVILAAFVVGFAFAAFVGQRSFVASAREEVLQQARLVITAANAVRSYTADELDGLLPMEKADKFVPQTVPAYAAQKSFKAVQTEFAGFVYREPALNPTNLSDRAQDWEADIIGVFRNQPDKQELVVQRDTAVGPTLSLARPITIREDACLTCHSAPAAAPAALTKTYGTANGFGWKLNETIGAQILSLPMAVPLKIAHDAYVGFLTILVEIFALVFVVLNLLLHYLVIAPVKRVSAVAEAVSLGEDVEPYVKPGKDEISALSVAFNRMRESLRHAMEMIK